MKEMRRIQYETLICIVARESSRRLPGKVVRTIDDDGKVSMLEFLIKRIAQFTVAPICVCTDNESPNVVSIAEQNRASVVRGHKKDVASRLIEAADMTGAQAIVRVTGDNPFTCPGVMLTLIGLHHSTAADYTAAPNFPGGTKSEVIDASALRCWYDEQPPHVLDDTEFLSRYLCNWKNRCIVDHRVQYGGTFTVDTKDQLQRARDIYRMYEGEVPIMRHLIDDLIGASLSDLMGASVQPSTGTARQ